jgi:hypothetical protein
MENVDRWLAAFQEALSRDDDDALSHSVLSAVGYNYILNSLI